MSKTAWTERVFRTADTSSECGSTRTIPRSVVVQRPVEVLESVTSCTRWPRIGNGPILIEPVELEAIHLARLNRRRYRSDIGNPILTFFRQTGRMSDCKRNHVNCQLNVDAHPASPVVLRILPSLISRHSLRSNIRVRCRVSGNDGDQKQLSRSYRLFRRESPTNDPEALSRSGWNGAECYLKSHHSKRGVKQQSIECKRQILPTSLLDHTFMAINVAPALRLTTFRS